MAELGLHGLPGRPTGVDHLDHYGVVLDMLPPQFTSVWISDHFQHQGEPLLEGWTLLTHLATAYPRFVYGHLVLGQSYRNPGLLAKMAQTLQYVTRGRFVLGIGAGWLEDEYRALGYEYPRPGIRVEQLAEAIQAIRAVWTQTDFTGDHYRVERALCDAPVPAIPIMIGTNGPRALGVAARHADWWNWDAPWEPTYRPPYERLRRHCDEIGRDFSEIVLTAGAFVDLPNDPSTFEPSYEHEFYPGQEFGILGPTSADAVREIETLVDLGVSHFQVSFADMTSFKRFIDEVVPVVRLCK